MTDYSDWKVLKSVINYVDDDEEKQAEAQAAQAEYTEVAEWCNEGGEYHITETDLYYEVVENSAPTPPTYDEIRQMRIMYRRANIDDQTAERSRKIANNTWTEEDEQAYLALDAEVMAYIEEHYPYPVVESEA